MVHTYTLCIYIYIYISYMVYYRRSGSFCLVPPVRRCVFQFELYNILHTDIEIYTVHINMCVCRHSTSELSSFLKMCFERKARNNFLTNIKFIGKNIGKSIQQKQAKTQQINKKHHYWNTSRFFARKPSANPSVHLQTNHENPKVIPPPWPQGPTSPLKQMRPWPFSGPN